MTDKRPLISAHRGGGERFRPETYEAYEHAAASGAEYVEFDVRRLGDGTLVCFHDESVRSRADGVAELRRLSYDELRARAGYDVPLAATLMPMLAGRSMGHVDLKEAGYERQIITMAIDAFGVGNFIVTSLSEGSVRTIRREFPDVAAALSLGRGIGDVRLHRLPGAIVGDLFPVRRIQACGATGAAMDKRLAPWGVLRRCARIGVTTMVWTVDRAREIDRLLANPRVDILVTNRPLWALQRRAGR